MAEKKVGKVEHYYPKVQAAAVGLSAPLKVGDKVHIVGHGDDFEEKVESLQLDHKPIQEGRPGQSVGLWVKERVHEGDEVYVVQGRETSADNRTTVVDRPTAGTSAARKPARKARAAKSAKRTRKAPTRKRAASRVRKAARGSASPKRKPARTSTRGKRVTKSRGKRVGRKAGARKGAVRKRAGTKGAGRKTARRGR